MYTQSKRKNNRLNGSRRYNRSTISVGGSAGSAGSADSADSTSASLTLASASTQIEPIMLTQIRQLFTNMNANKEKVLAIKTKIKSYLVQYGKERTIAKVRAENLIQMRKSYETSISQQKHQIYNLIQIQKVLNKVNNR